MDLAAINAPVVRQALRATRYGAGLQGNPLLALDAVALRLRVDRMPDTPQGREWALGGLIEELVKGELARLRGADPAVSNRDMLDTARETALIEDDFRAGNAVLECWSSLYARYLALREWQLGELADLLGAAERTLDRRTVRGFGLLAAALGEAEIEAARKIDTAPGLPAPARIVVSEAAPDRTVPETQAALLEAMNDDAQVVRIAPAQIEALVEATAPDFTTYRLGRIAEWSQPRYRLDERFVDLSLLIDMGQDDPGGRWVVDERRFSDLRDALAEVESACLVLLGSPGSGKSTILRRLELDLAVAGLRGETSALTFFVPLNRYRSPWTNQPPPPPQVWLAERWAARYPGLPPLDELLAAGQVVLLLDALNEMPNAGMADYRERVNAWKDFLQEAVVERPGNRVVFSCRSLDYSAPLGSPTLPVPQLRIEPMSDEQMARFLRLYSPARGEAIWRQLRGSPQHGLLRTPYFLSLLVQQVETEGRLPEGHAALFTGYVRQVLRREVERGHRLFAPDHLLTARDCRRTVQTVPWRTPFDLPEQGPLIPKLAELAYGMQQGATAREASQVRARYETVLKLVDHADAEDIVLAGAAMSVLDEDMAGEEVMFFHQLLQEYFAARRMSDGLDPALVRTEWQADDVAPSLADTLASLAPSEPLPPPEPTGWEETAVLATAMSADPSAFAAALADANLPLAARCAAQPEARVSAAVKDSIAWQLVRRSRDPRADLRARIAAGLMLAELGDPRFERCIGPHGDYLLPPLVQIPGGDYPIGSDDGPPEERPRHTVTLEPFWIGQFPVTNVEWALFMAAGGYEDERWWDTPAALAWQRGEGTAEGARWNYRQWRRRFQADPNLMAEKYRTGKAPEVIYRQWVARMKMTDAEFEAHLRQKWPGGPKRAPETWPDASFNNPSQPVVGISWFEARAYGNWLAAQTGRPFRLPSEVEWEAAVRGLEGRRHAHGNTLDPLKGNTVDTRIRRTTPIGVFPEGDTPEGVADMTGNVVDWTTSLFSHTDKVHTIEPARFSYPYDPRDGREDSAVKATTLCVLRGAGWTTTDHAQLLAASRRASMPDFRAKDGGMRMAVSSGQP